MRQFIGIVIMSVLIGWSMWQLGWRGGKPEHGRESDAAGGRVPFW